jgi:hypothetical protein
MGSHEPSPHVAVVHETKRRVERLDALGKAELHLAHGAFRGPGAVPVGQRERRLSVPTIHARRYSTNLTFE